MENSIEMKNVTKNYGGFTLDNISLSLPGGTIMGFIGENGAGKTTTIKLILDLISRDCGDIKVLGQDMKAGGKELKEHIGVVLDESCYPESLKISDVNRILKLCYKSWDEKAFFSYAQKFSLPSDKLVKEFSRGTKMKLSIAAALSHDSKLLILDEASSGLDPIVRDEILDMLLDFIQDETHSVLISSHIISDLEKICDYICFIHKGKIVFTEAKDALLEKYAILKCPEDELSEIDKSAVVGVRKNKFGAEALVMREKIKGNFVIDHASIEDIMLYFIKERVS